MPLYIAELRMDWIHPWIGLGRNFEERVWMDWIGSEAQNHF